MAALQRRQGTEPHTQNGNEHACINEKRTSLEKMRFQFCCIQFLVVVCSALACCPPPSSGVAEGFAYGLSSKKIEGARRQGPHTVKAERRAA